MDGEVTGREFGSLEERVNGVLQRVDLAEKHIGEKIDGFRADFVRHAEESGKRTGILEREFSEHRVENEKSEAERRTERRITIALLMLVQSVFLAVFGAWIKGVFQP